ncbi:MAG: DEAD/DEAH box helicase [Sulfitobacter sp.]
MTQSHQRLLDILSFWHKVEFFIPFDLDNRAVEQTNQKKLWRAYGQTSELKCDDVPKGFEVSRYKLYLGAFDKSVIKDVLPNEGASTENESFEDRERSNLEGLTCMASIGLAPDASPVFDDFEISTLPWAIGQSRAKGLGALSSDAFQDARARLKRDLHNFAVNRRTFEGGDERDAKPRLTPLAPNEIESLIDLLATWSGFRPAKTQHAALLEVTFRKKQPPKTTSAGENKSSEDDADDEVEEEPAEIGILNSFFIDDIERAILSVRAGQTPHALRQYLTPLPVENRIDLYSDVGREQIIAALNPARHNAGRWFANPDHAMSLMQQFAINTGLDTLQHGGLFSVNGPPGTGKTTLLRDIIAENVTRRAAILAGLNSPRAAFLDGKFGTIAHLIPELTGFEMVVASSNNAAVENISRDLPKSASVWGEDIQYLQPTAHKLAAQKADGKCDKLSADECPWGLITAAMGRKANRKLFTDRVFFNRITENEKKTWAGEKRPLNIWQWSKTLTENPESNLDFKTAQNAFKASQSKVDAITSDLRDFSALSQSMRGHTAESWCDKAKTAVIEAQLACKAARVELEAAERIQTAQESDLSDLKEEDRLLMKITPVWWMRLLRTQKAQAHNERVQKNAEAQIVLNQQVRETRTRISVHLNPALDDAEVVYITAQSNLKNVGTDWDNKCSAHDAYKVRFGPIDPPKDLDDLEVDAYQIEGVWHTPEYAKLRSDLFQKSLLLHEAWLLAVTSKSNFIQNLMAIPELLQNSFAGSADDERALWQSIFMIVPVISSTFASISRQFGDLGAESLGWLFIDEAGQAVPQAAVGAIMRAKRVFVIGDPLQIEPVFTLPKRLIQELMQTSAHIADGSYAPDEVSVQVLADRANPFGTLVHKDGDDDIWVGSPLRVHRRCIDPMFGLANKIAYNDRMVFGLESRDPTTDEMPLLGQSCWIDLPGKVVGRQAVPGQIDFVARLIARFYTRFEKFPNLYVISPFKEVKERLAARLKERELWDSLNREKPPSSALDEWIKTQVGTVHTFQGKEEDTVIMLLGVDAQTEGAAGWASSKPNLLNVALTRAKRRFYLVGDRQIWGKQRYFKEAYNNLPAIGSNNFEDAVEKEWAL